MRVVGSYAVNWMKFDCIRNVNDEKTWPNNNFANSNAGCLQGSLGQTTPEQCMALAQRLVSAEDL